MPFPLPPGLFPVPQHPQFAEPCCIACGKRDGRTAALALYCHECKDAGADGPRFRP